MPPPWLAWLLPLLAIAGLLVGWGEAKARLRSASELAAKTAEDLARVRTELTAELARLRVELTAELTKSRSDQGRRVGVVEERLAYLSGQLEAPPPDAGGRRRTVTRGQGVPVTSGTTGDE